MSSIDVGDDLMRALVDVAREMPPNALMALCSALTAHHEDVRATRPAGYAVTAAMQGKIEELMALVPTDGGMDGRSLAVALQVAAYAHSRVVAERAAEIVWTGPATEAVPVRRVDQVIYDLIQAARKEVLLVTYAAYRASRALDELRRASERGVQVKLVLELATESGGRITFDNLQAFRSRVPQAQVFYWPIERRNSVSRNIHGSMHAKCLVADRKKALVSSANLTDHALEANMELGLLVGDAIAVQVALHFEQLIARGELAFLDS